MELERSRKASLRVARLLLAALLLLVFPALPSAGADEAFLDSLDRLARSSVPEAASAALAAHAAERWNGNFPFDDLLPEIERADRSDAYRLFLAGEVSRNLRRAAGRDPLLHEGLGGRFIRTLETLKAVPVNRDASPALRAGCLDAAAPLYLPLRGSLFLSGDARSREASFFETFLEDPTENDTVRGRSAKALRCIGDPASFALLRRVVSGETPAGPFATRSAIVALAKLNDREAPTLITERLRGERDPKVLMTGVYSLGLYRDPAFVGAALEAALHLGGQAGPALVRGMATVIVDAVRKRDRAVLVEALEAAAFARLDDVEGDALDLLKDSDPAVRTAAARAVLALGTAGELRAAVASTAGESDPLVLEALRPLREKAGLVYREPRKSGVHAVLPPGVRP